MTDPKRTRHSRVGSHQKKNSAARAMRAVAMKAARILEAQTVVVQVELLTHGVVVDEGSEDTGTARIAPAQHLATVIEVARERHSGSGQEIVGLLPGVATLYLQLQSFELSTVLL